MKRSNIGIKDIATFENAEDAYRKARKCKRYREEVLRFTDNLEEVLQKIDAFLGERLKLTLNPKTQIINAKNGFDFCGYRIYKDYRKIRKRSPKHIRAVIKAYRSGKITKEKLLMKYASWEGHAKHADTYRLRTKIKGQIEAEIKKKELIGNGSITPDN